MSRMNQPATPAEVQVLVDQAEGLTLGYIGNMDNFGNDDTCQIIWVDGARDPLNGQSINIWSAESKTMTRGDVNRARAAIKIFMLGWNGAKLNQGAK